MIMNIMLMVVTERTREIGLRKALGRAGRDIMAQMLTESVVLSIFGGVIGTVLGAPIAITIAQFTPIPASVELLVGRARASRITALVGLFFGLYPAMRAARLDPDRSVEAGIDGVQSRACCSRKSSSMAFDTVRTNKMRSFLTVLGVVIGITSIVGMTAMIRGFDQSLRDLIAQSGPNIIYLQRFGVSQLRERRRVQRAAEAAEPDALATRARSRRRTATLQHAWTSSSARGPGPTTNRRVFYRDLKTKNLDRVRHRRDSSPRAPSIPMLGGRFFNGTDIQHRRNVVRAGQHRLQAVVRADPAPIRSARLVRIGSERFEVVGVFDKRPSPGGFNVSQDDFVVDPAHDLSARLRLRVGRMGRDAADHQRA